MPVEKGVMGDWASVTPPISSYPKNSCSIWREVSVKSRHLKGLMDIHWPWRLQGRSLVGVTVRIDKIIVLIELRCDKTDFFEPLKQIKQ